MPNPRFEAWRVDQTLSLPRQADFSITFSYERGGRNVEVVPLSERAAALL